MIKKFAIIFCLFMRSSSSDETKEISDEIGGLRFSFDLNNRLAHNNKVNNWCFSPFGVRVALAMISECALGDTASQLETVLELNDFRSIEDMHRVFQSCLTSLFTSSQPLFMATRIYVDQTFPISTSMNTTINTFYKASAQNIDFQTNPNDAVAEINLWIEHEMSDRFQELIPPGSLSADTQLVLVNAVYFRGRWKTRFDPTNTVLRDFDSNNGPDNIVQVPTMFVKSTFKYTYSSVLQSQVLELPYEGDRLVMHIILPEKAKKFLILISNELVKTYIHTLNFQEVKVYLPKFTSMLKTELKLPLRSLGIVDVFGENADLFISGKELRPRLTAVYHQAVVNVEEDGVEDANKEPQLAMTPIEFRVNQPCIFVIYDLKFKHILFMGELTSFKN